MLARRRRQWQSCYPQKRKSIDSVTKATDKTIKTKHTSANFYCANVEKKAHHNNNEMA
jgi:hypothetical protein